MIGIQQQTGIFELIVTNHPEANAFGARFGRLNDVRIYHADLGHHSRFAQSGFGR
jgi:hypothetical protein